MVLTYSMKERGVHSSKQKNIMMIVIVLFSIMAVIKFILFVYYNRNKMTKEAYQASFFNILF
jgi:multidrug resistance efflux pump